MQWRNSKDRFGWLAMSLHWVMAVMVPGLAAVGLWMTSLNYYSPWYTSAPFWHKSVGLVFAALLLVRLLWRWLSPAPAALPTHSRVERMAAGTAQWLMYAAMLIIVISGYLISTAKGSGVSLFGWFDVPALISGLPEQADRAGAVVDQDDLVACQRQFIAAASRRAVACGDELDARIPAGINAYRHI